MLTIYLIKSKKNGHYIPEPRGWYNNRGGSFTEPHADQQKARVFKSMRSAKGFLTQWLRGEHHGEHDYEDGYKYCIGATVRHIATRVPEDMEIVKIEIKLP